MDNLVAPNSTSEDGGSPRSHTTYVRTDFDFKEEHLSLKESPLRNDAPKELMKDGHCPRDYVKQREYDTLVARVETLEHLVRLMSRSHTKLSDEVKSLRETMEGKGKAPTAKRRHVVKLDDDEEADYIPVVDECRSSSYVATTIDKRSRTRAKRINSRGSRVPGKSKGVDSGKKEEVLKGSGLRTARQFASWSGHLIPRWLAIAFRPTEEMKLGQENVVIAAYIFSSEADQTKLLVSEERSLGKRDAFMTIVPCQPLMDEVLTMLTHNSCHTRWFMPPTFAYYMLE